MPSEVENMFDNAMRKGATIQEALCAAAQDYSTSVLLFASGYEAAQHGTDKILAPDERAVSAIEKIVKKRGL